MATSSRLPRPEPARSRRLAAERAALARRFAALVAARPRPPVTLHDETLRALVGALDLREQETAGHSHRVALWTLFFAAACDVDESELEAIHAGALLHDVGKIAIPDPILLKEGRLDPHEWRVMRTHPSVGRQLLARTQSLRHAAAIPWCHHERFDGSGYPRRLVGRRIPLGARLFAIIDVYDALRSVRPYKRAYSHARTMALLRAEAGRHFDPELLARFIALPHAALDRLAPFARRARPYAELRELVAATLAWVAARGAERAIKEVPRTARSRRPRRHGG